MKKLKNYIEYYLVRSVAWLLNRLPYSWALGCGRFLAWIIFYFIPIRKKVTLQNISQCFPEWDRRQVRRTGWRCYRHFAMTFVEFIRMPQHGLKLLDTQVTFNDRELLQRAKDNGRGAICLSGHFGNWELLGAAIRQQGFPLSGIARRQRNRMVDELIQQVRHAMNLGVIDLGMAVRGVFRALRSNDFIAILADQDARRRGIFIDFFGRPSSTATGPAIFVLKSGSPLLFGVCVREKDGRQSIHFKNVEHSDLDGVTEENIRILTQRHATILEECIRQWPEQWFWMHRRWKTKPR